MGSLPRRSSLLRGIRIQRYQQWIDVGHREVLSRVGTRSSTAAHELLERPPHPTADLVELVLHRSPASAELPGDLLGRESVAVVEAVDLA
jgi:hypothetical protein